MRTWTIQLPQTPPFTTTVRAFDGGEAMLLLAEKLGLVAEPCCELEDEPCAACRDDARLAAEMRAEDRGMDAERGGR